MKKSLILHTLLIAANVAVFFNMTNGQMDWVGQQCTSFGDNSPGVTVFLDTTSAEAVQTTSSQQWTAVSFKEAGHAPDGSKQAVLSIQRTNVKKDAVGILPAKATPHWQ